MRFIKHYFRFLKPCHPAIYLVTTSAVAIYQHDYRSGGLLSGGIIHSMINVFDAPDNHSQRLGRIGIREFSSPPTRMPHLRVTAVGWRYQEDPSVHNQWGGALAIGFRTGNSVVRRPGGGRRQPAVPRSDWLHCLGVSVTGCRMT